VRHVALFRQYIPVAGLMHTNVFIALNAR
jgi:hypothetical protein